MKTPQEVYAESLLIKPPEERLVVTVEKAVEQSTFWQWLKGLAK